MTSSRNVLFFLFLIFVPVPLIAEPPLFAYPRIKDLGVSDYLFLQYSEDVKASRRALAENRPITKLPFKFYVYRAKKDDSIIRIAARCSIPQDAIITINRIESAEDTLTGMLLLLPTVPALYLPENPASGIEKLTAAFCEKTTMPHSVLHLPNPEQPQKSNSFLCIPNALFDGTVRAFFFRPLYVFPLKVGVLTSDFGMRISPFSGKRQKHGGIDIGAPTGTPVYACAAGTVKKTGFSRIYGKYIILKHIDGRESLYGHLSRILVGLHQIVKSDTMIGAVGSTGLATGPHLHFEIHENGVKKNPGEFVDKNELNK